MCVKNNKAICIFFVDVGLFLIPFIIVSFVFDFYISDSISKSKKFALGEINVWNDIETGKIDDEIYIYGSSRAWVHFDPEIIEEGLNMTTYNFGVDGHSFWIQYLRHKKLFLKKNKPKIIILSLGNFSLYKRPDLYNKDQFLPYVFDKDIREFTKRYKGFSYFEYRLPMLRYFGRNKIIKQSLFNEFSEEEIFRDKGFRGVNRTWTADFEKARGSSNYIEVEIDEDSLILLEKFIEECTKEKVKLIFVFSPEYIEGQLFVRNRGDVIQTYKGLTNRNDIVFLDYSDDELCFEKKFFYNSQHLNSIGAKKFSEKLTEDLKRILINN